MRRSRAQERLRGLFRVLRVGAEDLGTGLCVPGHDRRAGTGSDPHQHVDPPDSQAAQDHTYLVRPGGPFPRGGLLHDGQPADVPADRGTACGGGGVPGPGYLHPAARRKAGGLGGRPAVAGQRSSPAVGVSGAGVRDLHRPCWNTFPGAGPGFIGAGHIGAGR